MPRKLDAKAQTPDLHWHPTDPEDVQLCRDIKKILSTDGENIGDFLRPFLKRERNRRSPSNPQSMLTPDLPYPITLSEAQREKLGIPEGQAVIFDQEIDCKNCGKRHKSQVTCWNPREYLQ